MGSDGDVCSLVVSKSSIRRRALSRDSTCSSDVSPKVSRLGFVIPNPLRGLHSMARSLCARRTSSDQTSPRDAGREMLVVASGYVRAMYCCSDSIAFIVRLRQEIFDQSAIQTRLVDLNRAVRAFDAQGSVVAEP